jgi:hypothetical protein
VEGRQPASRGDLMCCEGSSVGAYKAAKRHIALEWNEPGEILSQRWRGGETNKATGPERKILMEIWKESVIISPQMCYDHPLCYYIVVHQKEISSNTKRQAGVNNWLQSRFASFNCVNLVECVSAWSYFRFFRMTTNVPAQWVTLLLHTEEVQHSYLGTGTGLYRLTFFIGSLRLYRKVRGGKPRTVWSLPSTYFSTH